MSRKAKVAEGLRLLTRRGFPPSLVSPTGANAPSCGVVRGGESGKHQQGVLKRIFRAV